MYRGCGVQCIKCESSYQGGGGGGGGGVGGVNHIHCFWVWAVFPKTCLKWGELRRSFFQNSGYIHGGLYLREASIKGNYSRCIFVQACMFLFVE